jgi:hypothetical protein
MQAWSFARLLIRRSDFSSFIPPKAFPPSFWRNLLAVIPAKAGIHFAFVFALCVVGPFRENRLTSV